MATIDTRPTVVDIDHYAGDTLVLHVKVSDAVVGDRVFTAQVRKNRGNSKLDATMEIHRIPGFGADVVLKGADGVKLANRGNYNGFWDVQLAMPDGADPVTTLAHGELRLHLDVTRHKT